ncbi:MAG TPA: NAD(P)H-dependent oxidoreductase [Bdellovibrionota bacterium]|jgi:NAD(P)H-dependent FMN reductase|nr:NAD(P)H-dependent oxidoreductase [Bdellovibrionota bacterium]
MKAFIVSGSHRHLSESARVGEYIQNRLAALKVSTDTTLLDLGKTPLPLWDEGVGEGEGVWKSEWEPVNNTAKMADIFVLITPEWAGMVTPAMKNFLLLASGTGALAHKPALIVTVSAGKGGGYPISELRASGYKNSMVCYLPEHIIVRHVGTMLKGETPQNEDDTYVRQRLDYALKLLGGYGKALKEVRAAGLVDLKTYPNGM